MKKQSLLSALLIMLMISLSISCFATSIDSNHIVTESEVHFFVEGERINGILTRPESSEGPVPVVVLLHGFLGHMDDLTVYGSEESLYRMTARLFAEKGLASLRFDFRAPEQVMANGRTLLSRNRYPMRYLRLTFFRWRKI